MAHFHERDRVHAHQGPARRHTGPVQSRTTASVARIDCDSCPVAGRGCAGCMVALLGPVRLRLDPVEQAAVDALVDAGLVDAAEARSAYAEPDLPDVMLRARQAHDGGPGPEAATGAGIRTA